MTLQHTYISIYDAFSLDEVGSLEGHEGAELVVVERDSLLPQLVSGSDLGLLDHFFSALQIPARHTRTHPDKKQHG